MDLRLRGKKALITGASKGIGFACAKQLAEEGCDVLLASRTRADLETAAEKIRAAHNVNVGIHAVDLSDGDVARSLIAENADLDILVNNAGAIPGGSVTDIDEETWRTAWDLKVFGFINLTRAAYTSMKARGGGVIVNVIGMAAINPRFGYVAGATGNAGLNAFTKAMGGNSMKDNVRIVACNPGLIVTDRMTTLLQKQAEDKFGDAGRWEELIPTDPPPGQPEHVGDLVAYLASERAAHISGTVIDIDGGATTRTPG